MNRKRQTRTKPDLDRKQQCFIGVLYPAKRLLWHYGGEFPAEALDEAAKMVSDPDFWEGIETLTDHPIGRAVGRLVELLSMKDRDNASLIQMLAIAICGMTADKFLWFKVEEHKEKPQAPEGKTLEASFMIYPRVLDTTSTDAARDLFFEDTEVGLANNKMWLLQEHEAQPLMDQLANEPRQPPPTEAPKRKLIADIYLRVAAKSAESGLRRQEEVCREWCQEEGVEVRHVIKDIGRAFGVERKAGRAFSGAMDSWRKKYWEDKGEPLDTRECDPTVQPISPPDCLVMESADRLFATGVTQSVFLIKLLESIGMKVVSVNTARGTTSVSGPVTFHDPEGIGVQVNPNGSMIFARSDRLRREG
jgi:hypothetical protein